MGMSREQADNLVDGGVDWKWAVQEVGEESAWWAESMICQAIALYHFDWESLREELRGQSAGGFLLARPDGKAVSLSTLLPEEQENALLTLVAQGGSNTIAAAPRLPVSTRDRLGQSLRCFRHHHQGQDSR